MQPYLEQLADPDRQRPAHCPQRQAKIPLTAHGFYTRTLIDSAFDGVICVRRYLCQACRRTVSLLPEFALPYLRSSVALIALFLVARLLQAKTLTAAPLPGPVLSDGGYNRQRELVCLINPSESRSREARGDMPRQFQREGSCHREFCRIGRRTPRLYDRLR